MRWEDFRRSDNIEDRRDDDETIGAPAGMPGFGGGQLGLGAIVVLGLIGWALGIDPRLLIGSAEMVQSARHNSPYSQSSTPSQQSRTGTPSDQIGQFVAATLAQTEDVWSDILPKQKHIRYIPPHLVLFKGRTRSGCGGASAAMGPFYCPIDQKVYLDTSFFADMKRRYGGGGDFAYAYVIAHEIGHHVQDELGILSKVRAAEQRAVSGARRNALSVRIELMADCFAGVWAANAQAKYHVIEPGDIEKAIATAQAIGDDRLQQASRGTIVPDSFTHGSSVQRVNWFNTGLKSGQVDACNTFAQ
ncbi:MAG: KPN_02809 family neutral zinc metallopeptidase [Methylovirgula sp.]